MATRDEIESIIYKIDRAKQVAISLQEHYNYNSQDLEALNKLNQSVKEIMRESSMSKLIYLPQRHDQIHLFSIQKSQESCDYNNTVETMIQQKKDSDYVKEKRDYIDEIIKKAQKNHPYLNQKKRGRID
ncbi:hypothetical protein pb186bvf_012047 [Paramecium bursaria]